jgi:hypothetical protein
MRAAAAAMSVPWSSEMPFTSVNESASLALDTCLKGMPAPNVADGAWWQALAGDGDALVPLCWEDQSEDDDEGEEEDDDDDEELEFLDDDEEEDFEDEEEGLLADDDFEDDEDDDELEDDEEEIDDED